MPRIGRSGPIRVLASNIDLSNNLRGEQFFDELAGWPMRCLRHEIITAQTSVGDIITDIHAGIELEWRTDNRAGAVRTVARMPSDQVAALPHRAVWPGLAINTAFYTPLAWLLTYGPGAARRTLRRRRGACEACGYDLRGLITGPDATCPECGGTNAGRHAATAT